MSLARALELAAAAAGRAYPKPTVGAVVVAGRRDRRRGRHRAGRPPRRGRRARRRRRARARRDAVRHARAVRALGHDAAVHRARDRRRGSRGSWSARATRTRRPPAGSRRCARPASRSSSLDAWEARVQNEAWRIWVARGRPFVTYKVGGDPRRAGRRARPPLGVGRGEPPARPRAPRRLGRRRGRDGHGARRRAAARCARRADAARAAAPARVRPRPAARRARSSSCGRARSPTSCGRSPREGVQSLLLEGGPTLAGAFLDAGLVDKLLLFVAPIARGRRRAAASCRG